MNDQFNSRTLSSRFFAVSMLLLISLVTGCSSSVRTAASYFKASSTESIVEPTNTPTPTPTEPTAPSPGPTSTPKPTATPVLSPTTQTTYDAAFSKLVLRGATVIDDHQADVIGYTANGNCNGIIDAGETFQLVFDVANIGDSTIGPFSVKIDSETPTTDLVFDPNTSVGGWRPLKPGQNWIGSIPFPRAAGFPNLSNSIMITDYFNAYANGLLGFGVKATAQGAYKLKLMLNLLDSDKKAIRSITFPFTIVVGHSPPMMTCPANQWP